MYITMSLVLLNLTDKSKKVTLVVGDVDKFIT